MTPDPAQLPHLLRLLDDDSPAVQAAIWEELEAYGPGLEEELARQNLSLDGRRGAILLHPAPILRPRIA